MPKKIQVIIYFMINIICLTSCSYDSIMHNNVELGIYTESFLNNDNTKTIYVYSSPIAYKENGYIKRIDNKIIKTSEKDYKYQNKQSDVKVYFPENLINGIKIKHNDNVFVIKLKDLHLNFKNANAVKVKNKQNIKVDAVKYCNKNLDLTIFPTNFGIEITGKIKNKQINELKFLIESNNITFNKDVLYTSIQKDNKIIAVLNNFLLNDNINMIDFENNVINQDTNSFISTYHFNNEQDMNFTLNFDCYKEKMHDCSIYSKIFENTYLSNFSYLGETSYGIGYHLMKNNLSEKLDWNKYDILNITYHMNTLSSDENVNIDIYTNTEHWPSSMISWNDKVPRMNYLYSTNINKKGGIEIDLTDAILNNELDFGITLRSKSKVVLATNDHAYLGPYYKIHLRERTLK